MDLPAINELALCSGVGLLSEGVRAGCEYFGWRHRVVAHVERESYAAAALVARMVESSLDNAPIWDDLSTFDGRQWRGIVDIVSAGLPCQPYSVAGKQQGNSDHRSFGDGDGPIPHALRIIAECRPAMVFFENVPAWVCGDWFRPVGEELCRLGYTLEVPLFVTAESVGASHRRERVFILAHTMLERFGKAGRCAGGGDAGFTIGELGHASQSICQRDGRGFPEAQAGISSPRITNGDLPERPELAGFALGDTGSNGRGIDEPRRGPDSRTALGRTGASVVDASRKRRPAGDASLQRSGDQPAARQADDAGQGCSELAHPEQPGPQGIGPGKPQRRSELIALCRDWPAFAPGPSDTRWPGILRDAPWLAPAVESGFRLLVDGDAPCVLDASRADQLRCAGNSVVAMSAAVAFIELMRRSMT